MKYVIASLFFLVAFAPVYADDSCANNNPYVRRSCEKLKATSDSVQQARDEADKKELTKNQEIARQRIEQETKLSEVTPEPESEAPLWQKALKPEVAIANNSATEAAKNTPAPSGGGKLAPLPDPGPAKFSSPEAVTLPGGVQVIPVPADQKKGKSATITYY